ncbi:MAG: pyruvate kinase, partial [Alphaproteobacteria bacterium]|nr:pyruvate kinase [Alphaproteobacteria bacterium]
MKRNRRAKIVATIGPATSSEHMIRQMFLAGVDVFRLNFSHGSQDDHATVHGIIRALEKEVARPIGILQDLQGPKIRVGTIKDGRINVQAGETVRFVLEGEAGDRDAIPLPHPEIFASTAPGHRLLIDDGRLHLRVSGFDGDAIVADVIVGGAISNRKGVNVPDAVLELSPLTDKDRVDLEFGLKLGIDWLALSFVQRPSDIMEARQIVGDQAGIMAKIEKPAALDRIDDIVALCDAIMVARGDLGVEIPPEQVPGRQKELIRACRLAAKPVIVATQMLDSMANSPQPTRAEASDVATAIYDGADAVMLSQESAIGTYPVETVEMMDRIIWNTENHQAYRSIIDALEPVMDPSVHHAVSEAAADIANKIHAAAIVAFTSRGTTAYRIARKRPEVPILTVSTEPAIARRLTLLWGAHSVTAERMISSYDEMVEDSRSLSQSEEFAKQGERIVVIAGVPFGTPGSTNNIRVV